MRSFKITEELEVVCQSESTRYGFRHLATMLRNGSEIQDGKRTYQNRTWESYEFQSVLYEVVEKALKNKVISDEEEKLCQDFIKGDQTDWTGFKTVKAIAQMGELFCDNQKDKNDWKKRMLVAGLENKGLSMPEDWDTLDEDTKEARLNAVIENMPTEKEVTA